MDPKTLKILREFLGVDNKLLPDSINPETLGKFLDDQKGKLFGNPEDFKNLQKLISKKDVDFRKTKEALEKLKLTKDKDTKQETELEKLTKTLQSQLNNVTEKLDKINKKNEIVDLQKKYPDVLPELLTGKDDDQIKVIVERQRVMNKKLYGDSRHFTQPAYNDIDEIQKEIAEVKDNKQMSGEKSAVKVLQLGRVKDNLQTTEPEL